MYTEKSFDNGNLVINYFEGPPSGIPLVLCHGVPGRWQEFLPIIPALATQFHIYAVDARGQGKSGRTPGKYHSRFYGEDLISFLEFINEPVFIFGESAGGMIGLAAAVGRPDLVKALVIGDSPLDFSWIYDVLGSPQMQHLFTVWQKIAGLDIPVTDLCHMLSSERVFTPDGKSMIVYSESPGMSTTSFLHLTATLKMMDPGVLEYHAKGRMREFLKGVDIVSYLENLNCPLLLLQAGTDRGTMLTDWAIDAVRTAVPTVSHVVMEQYGHDLGMGSWDVSALLDTLTGFLMLHSM